MILITTISVLVAKHLRGMDASFHRCGIHTLRSSSQRARFQVILSFDVLDMGDIFINSKHQYEARDGRFWCQICKCMILPTVKWERPSRVSMVVHTPSAQAPGMSHLRNLV